MSRLSLDMTKQADRVNNRNVKFSQKNKIASDSSTDALQFCQGFDHALTYFPVRQFPNAGAHVVFEMLDVVRRRNRASHRRIGNDPLQKKLRPGSAIKFCREIGQRLSTDATEKIAAAKGTINNDGDATLLRER